MLRTLSIHCLPADSIVEVSSLNRPAIAEAAINSASMDMLLQRFDQIVIGFTEKMGEMQAQISELQSQRNNN